MKLVVNLGKKWAVGALFLTAIVTGALLQPAMPIYAKPVTASQEWKNCYDLAQRYPNGFLYNDLTIADQKIIQGCFDISQDNGSASTANGSLQSSIKTASGAAVCATQKQDATGKVLVTCMDPVAYENAPTIPVVNLLCSQYLDYYGQGGTQYSSCESSARDAYKACYVPVATGGSTGYIDPLVADVAKCIKQKTGTKVDVASITNAITAGEAALAKVVTDGTAAIDKTAKTECLARGGTWDDSQTDPTKACTEKVTTAPTSTCTVEGIGWIICPVMNFMGGILDKAYSAVSGLTSTPASVLSDPARQGWSIFRDLANIILVIAFMIIVFSQITGRGASNYGIKKMLPKLVIVAVLINISFFLCQLAVDLSNVVGAGVYSLLKSLPVYQSSSNILNHGSIVGDVIAVILGSATAVGTGVAAGAAGLAIATTQGALVVILPVVIAAVAAILVTVVVLVMRPALVIILTVIAPVAIATTLLPNLEGVYKKWQQYFIATLVLFPMISLLFGGAQVAAAILIQSMGISTIDASSIGKNIGAFISVIVTMNLPLIAVLPMIKGSLNTIPLLGKAMSAITSGGSKLSGFATGKLKENGGLIAAYSQRNPGNKWARRLSEGVHGKAIRVPGVIPKIGGMEIGATQATLKTAKAAEDYNRAEVAAATFNLRDVTVDDAATMAAKGEWKGVPGKAGKMNQAERLAVIDKAMSSGGFSQRREIVSALSDLDHTDVNSRELMNRANAIAYQKGDQNIFGVGFGDSTLNGTVKGQDGIRQSTISNLIGGNLSAEHIVQNVSATKYLHEMVESMADGVEKQKARQALAGAVTKARANDNTKAKINDELELTFAKIESKATPPATGAPATP